ncbi:hypothetical protein JCM11251_003311 [Rhodosporidiobolus azoricus]
MSNTFDDPPPAYATATGTGGGAPTSPGGHLNIPTGSTQGHRRTTSNASNSDWTASSNDEGGSESVIPREERMEMMDQARPLPEGWRREWDPNSQHFFYVDTKANPPRSIWSHPLDDPEYLSAHPKEAKELASGFAPPEGAPPGHSEGPDSSSTLKPTPSRDHVSAYEHDGKGKGKDGEDKRTLGRRMKDKIYGNSHEDRVAERKKRQEEEMKMHQLYLQRRAAILRAQQQGAYRPMYAAPAGPYSRGPMYAGSGIGMPAYGYGGYGGGMYGSPYRRGPGMGMAMGGGLLGGLLLGDMLF